MSNGKIVKTFFILLVLALLGQAFVPFFSDKNAIAATVFNISDTISDSRASQPANHLIAFSTVNIISSGDTVVIKFDNTGNAFDFSSLTPLDILDYDFSVDGIDYNLVAACTGGNNLAVSTDDTGDEITFTACSLTANIAGGSDIRIKIGTNASFEGSGINQIQNPSIGASYFIDISGTFGDTGITVIVTTLSSGTSVSATVEALTPPSSGGGGIIISTGNLKMVGKAYPNAFMTVLKNGQVVGTKTADRNGNFEMTIKSIPSNKIYDFGVFARDDLNLLSPTLNYNLSINTNQITEINNVYISPTIALSSNTVRQGDSLRMYGSSYPNSLMVNFVSPSFKTTSLSSNKEGHWTYSFDSTDYAVGKYFTKAKTIFTGGEQSEYSEELSFNIIKRPIIPKPPDLPVPPGECNGADLNNDSKVDILDFSILLHYWKSKNPFNRCADINQDETVDVYDFSVLMYYWTG